MLDSCGLKSFRYSPLGLRDGLLAQMAAEYDQHTRSHQQLEADRFRIWFAQEYADYIAEVVLDADEGLR